MNQLHKDADIDEIKDAILGNRYIAITEEDAGRVAEWASYKGHSKIGLLIIGRTGMGKSQLVQTLWPIFDSPCNGYTSLRVLVRIEWPRPMIVEEWLGLGDKGEGKLIEALGECPSPLLVTSYSDVPLKGEWIRVTLKPTDRWRHRNG